MADDKPDNTNRLAQLTSIAEERANIFDGWQKIYSKRAQEAGYARDLFRKAAGEFQKLPDGPYLTTAINSLSGFRDYVIGKEEEIKSAPSFADIAYTIVTSTVAVTGVALHKLDMPSIPSMPTFPGNVEARPTFYYPIAPPPYEPPGAEQIYAEKLEKRDAELGRVYRSIWEGLRGTSSDPVRIALHQMRQTFDHFFNLLAPDDDVRRSAFFKRKKGDKEQAKVIHRTERICYAANVQISDKEKGLLLSSQADTIRDTYNELNKLHKRGPLNRELALQTLTAMDRILREWIDAILP